MPLYITVPNLVYNRNFTAIHCHMLSFGVFINNVWSVADFVHVSALIEVERMTFTWVCLLSSQLKDQMQFITDIDS
ncbi:MAG: hypothetical protein J4G19_07485 [Pseudomonadales bacterium]|nr:hypothetical protein [Pseudomonadales bacterium]